MIGPVQTFPVMLHLFPGGILGHHTLSVITENRSQDSSRHDFAEEMEITGRDWQNIFLVRIPKTFLVAYFGYVISHVTRLTGSCVGYLEPKTPSNTKIYFQRKSLCFLCLEYFVVSYFKLQNVPFHETRLYLRLLESLPSLR